MKEFANLLLAVCAFAVAACNQPVKEGSSAAAVDTTAERVVIEKQVSDLTAALLSGSRDSLNNLTSDNLSYGHSNGDMQTKSGFVDSLATGNWGFNQINIADQQVVNIDGNTAIVRQKLYGEAQNKGKDPAKLALGVLMVWKKEGDKWLLYARQAFKLLSPNDVPSVK
ncbi:nuclear transport factor 2 family protein [Mucilaginibacter auburnensis]|uniref:Uncharacterized protein DUF4440 n=1 Tax=Mucilaginibacter auburnensis TaxID=1457233 RepID=A0A2H9VVM2_9SPHI|nr:nuclear transport factor 2 family protein [Mucilaginibacter auburnensis]PJJ84874.1 uncharacterized protein DUF4440 [Mucilaginibacter auburnensis]